MENSPNSSRNEAFPAGLRVLVVDDDPTWLKILEKMLRKCSYEVTTCSLARVALDLLREKRDRFDIVISDVNMPDMDGFKLLEHVGLEMDLPVIMMSVDGETSRVMKGVQHGACDYLLKPIRMKELKNIWQHVFRKKIHEVKEVENHNGAEEFQLMRNRSNEVDDRLLFSGSDLNFSKKRRDLINKDLPEQDFIDPSSVKKARVVWSVDLHQKFVNAVNQIGFDKVGPKKILDLMNVPGLTRENVASHLQKYRLYLSRLQKENEGMASGVSQPKSVSKDTSRGFDFQGSTASLHSSSDVYKYSSERAHISGPIPETRDHLNNITVKQEELKKVVATGGTESSKTRKLSRLGAMNSSPEAIGPNADLKHCEHAIPDLHWHRSPSVQPVQQAAQQQDLFSLVSGYPCKQQLEYKDLLGGILPISSSVTASGCDELGSSTSTNFDCTENHLTNLPTSPCKINSFTNQNEAGVRGIYGSSAKSMNLGVTLGNTGSSTTKSRFPDQYLIDLIESSSQTSNLTEETTVSTPDNAHCFLEGYGYFEKPGINSLEILQYDNVTPTNLSGNMNNGLQFDSEYEFDLMEYPIMGGSLFT